MSFESESVNENVFFVKGKVHCVVATLDGKELRQKAGKILIRYRFFRFRRKTNLKQKNLKKESEIMETNVKKVFLASSENCENCYIFSPSIGRKKNVGGKTYNVKRYFNGNRDFETSMKELAAKQATKIAR